MYVAGLAVQNIVVHIDHGDEAVVAKHLDVTQRTQVVGAAGHVEGIEDGGKGRQGVGAWHAHLAHHVDHDSLGLPHGKFYLGTLIAASQCAAQPRVGLGHGEPAHLYGSETLDGNLAIGRHGGFQRLLRRAVDIYYHGIARAQPVVARSGNVHIGLEGELLIIKYVATEDTLDLLLGHQLAKQGGRVGG